MYLRSTGYLDDILRLKRSTMIIIIAILLSGCANHPIIPVENQTTPAKKITYGFYIVEKGDTLISIALRYGWRYLDLAALNHIRAPYTLRVGQTLYFDDVPVITKKSEPYKKKTSTITEHAVKTQVLKKTTKIEKSKHLSNRKVRIKHGIAWQWPLVGKILKPDPRQNRLAKGINIGCKVGDIVRATAAGKIVYAGNGLRGYGLLIIIKHNAEFLSAYAHNSQLQVHEGQFVSSGQPIAKTGSTGTTRPLLHFEIRRHGKPVSPLQYLPQ